uniref:Uncharacterized protein n=1 Tax=Lotus japonicus TaxID=34305 RepID=I3T0L2_LOTJA|nr:unknown [Lotus japonicus]
MFLSRKLAPGTKVLIPNSPPLQSKTSSRTRRLSSLDSQVHIQEFVQANMFLLTRITLKSLRLKGLILLFVWLLMILILCMRGLRSFKLKMLLSFMGTSMGAFTKAWN